MESVKPAIACFIGWSDTGKSSFIEATLSELRAAGVPAAAVKCVRHRGSFNLPGKDSSRFFEACGAAALVSETEAMLSLPAPPDWDRPWLESLFPGAAVILVEGRIVKDAARVLVGGPAETVDALKGKLGDFDAVLTDRPAIASIARDAGLAVFAPPETGAFISRYLGRKAMEEREVTVKVAGLDVPLNPFVRETILNVVLGLVKPLKKTDPDAEIVIRIGPAK